jgi:hypothetical protein
VSERIEVVFPHGMPDGDMQAVADVFRSEGIPAEVRTYQPPPVGNGWGFHVLLLIVGSGLTPFIAGYFGAAGADAWRKTKEFVGKLKQHHHDRYPEQPMDAELELELVDNETGTHVFIRSSMPDDGFQKLPDLEFEPDTWYVWEPAEGEWVKREPGGLGFTPDDLYPPPDAPARPRFRDRLRRLFRR